MGLFLPAVASEFLLLAGLSFPSPFQSSSSVSSLELVKIEKVERRGGQTIRKEYLSGRMLAQLMH